LSSNFTIVPDPTKPDVKVTTSIFVSAAVDETGLVVYKAGKVAPDPNTGVNTQTSIKDAVITGQMQGNQIIIRLSLDTVNKAVYGKDAQGNALGSVLGMTSTATDIKAQQLVGSSVSGGLLLAADTAGGADFVVGP
jgi:hypothetical protein